MIHLLSIIIITDIPRLANAQFDQLILNEETLFHTFIRITTGIFTFYFAMGFYLRSGQILRLLIEWADFFQQIGLMTMISSCRMCFILPKSPYLDTNSKNPV